MHDCKWRDRSRQHALLDLALATSNAIATEAAGVAVLTLQLGVLIVPDNLGETMKRLIPCKAHWTLVMVPCQICTAESKSSASCGDM